MKKIALLICISFFFNEIRADNFDIKSAIDSVSKTGFYKIVLSPEIISASRPDYADIRIFDSKHNEVPYILVTDQRATDRTGFKEYEVVENKPWPKQKLTRIVVHNSAKSIISSLSLIVRNSEEEKEVTLKGSDDRRNWYIIKRNYPVQSAEYNSETSKIMVLDFPKSNYEYFELSMNDKKDAPIQVMKVGYFDSEVTKGLYTALPLPSILQMDSAKAKKSYITLTFDRPYEISSLELTLNGPEFFMRQCCLGSYTVYQKKTVFQEIDRFIAYSKHQPKCEFEKIKTDKLVIIIDNSDNPPLKVTSVKAFQLNKYLIAKLKTNEKYDLFCGKNSLNAPEYDIKYFTDSIPINIPLLNTTKPILLNHLTASNNTIFFTKYVLWVVVGIIIVLLAWFSIRLVREMEKDK